MKGDRQIVENDTFVTSRRPRLCRTMHTGPSVCTSKLHKKRTFTTLVVVMMAAADAKPFSTGLEMKLTMKPSRSRPRNKHSRPIISVTLST